MLAPPAFSADTGQPLSTISVVGTATLKLPPDQITVPVTISTEEKEISDAKEKNDKKVKKILALAERYGVEKNDIKTTYHSVEPKMNYGQSITVETDVYTGSTSYTFDVKDLSQNSIDTLIEALQKADLNNVNHNKQQQSSYVYASFNARGDKIEVVRDKLKTNQDAIVKIATAQGVAKDNISTQTNQSKGKESRSESTKPRIESYKAIMSMNVVMKEKTKAIDFVNDAIKEGVENVGSISFGLKDEKSAQDKASLDALKDAKRKAAAMAEAMNVNIERPLSVSDSGAQLIPIQPYAFMEGRSSSDLSKYKMEIAEERPQSIIDARSLPTGLIEIRGSVNASFLVKQK